MGNAKGSASIVLGPELTEIVKAEQVIDHRSSITNTVEALVREAVQARLDKRSSDDSGE